jgi:hypothetical protein
VAVLVEALFPSRLWRVVVCGRVGEAATIRSADA